MRKTENAKRGEIIMLGYLSCYYYFWKCKYGKFEEKWKERLTMLGNQNV